jgi:type II secretory pathway pseudopilin PulG
MRPPPPTGSLLVEILIAVSIFAIIAAIGAQALFVSVRSNVAASQKGSGAQLLSELVQGARAASEEHWQNLYGLTKSSARYHPEIQNGEWVIVPGEEMVTLGTTRYARYFTVDNVSRDLVTRDIESTYAVANDDPATQKVMAVVVASSTEPLSISEYFFRWRNKTCNQTSWSGGAGSGIKSCPESTYGSSNNITPGADLQLCSGGC